MTPTELRPLIDGLIAMGYGDDELTLALHGDDRIREDWVLADLTPSGEGFTVPGFDRRPDS